MYDITIIGNGVLGLSTALSLILKNTSLKIGIIGNFGRKGSASVAAGAMINAVAEATDDSVKNPYGLKKIEISLAAVKKWEAWLELINKDLPLEKKVTYTPGTFVILNAKGGSLDTDNFDAIINAAKRFEEPCQEIHPKEVIGINPYDDIRPSRALWLKNEGCINSVNFLDALTTKLSSFSNVTFINDDVTCLQTSNGKISSITLTSGKQINSNKVLLAAGAYSQTLIDQVEEIRNKIPLLVAGVGISATIDQVEENKIMHVVRTPNRSGACGLHVLPKSKNKLYVGATNNLEISPKEAYKSGLLQFLIKCGIDQIDQDLYDSNLLDIHVGNRPVSLDTFPLVGHTSINNLYMLTGTYRDGFQQSPFWADYMSKIILEENVEYIEEFTPERSLIQIHKTKQDAIDTVVNQYMAGLYEHDMFLPRLFNEAKIKEGLYEKFYKLYDKLETDFPFISDILFLFELSKNNDKNFPIMKRYLSNL